MHPRFPRPMNTNGTREVRGRRPYSNTIWNDFQPPPFRQRPPFPPFRPPHVARDMPQFRPDAYQTPPNDERHFDAPWPMCQRPSFRGPFPNNDIPGQSFGGPNCWPPMRGNPQRGRGGYGRPEKRFYDYRNGDMPVKKKAKTKDKPSPESCRFYCEACDRGYQLEEKYEEHIQTHITCGWDGCRYVAAAKLVKIHRDQQHRTGLAKKIWQLETKEDIEKWITERRKNYPTKETVIRKQKHHEDRIRRGEVLETKQFGRFGRGRFRGRGRFQNRRQHPVESRNKVITGDNGGPEKPDGSRTGVDPLCFGVTVEQLDSDSDKECPGPLPGKTSEAAEGDGNMSALIGALGTIMSSYSGDSDTEKADIKANIKGTSEAAAEKAKSEEKPSEIQNKRQQKKRDKGSNQRHAPVRHRSLLEKLLAKEIRHERNVLLQCVRYIVQRNFFQSTVMSEVKVEEPSADCSQGECSTFEGDSMTKQQPADDSATRPGDDDPRAMQSPGENAMDVSEQPTVEEFSDADMEDSHQDEAVVIQDVSDLASTPVMTDDSKPDEVPDVKMKDSADVPVVQDPEMILIEDISEEPAIEEILVTNVTEVVSDDASDSASTEEEPIVQDIAEKPVIQDPPGTLIIQDITGLPIIKDLSGLDSIDEDEAVPDEEDDASPASDEEPIVQDLIDKPDIQVPPETPIIQDITGEPIICDVEEATSSLDMSPPGEKPDATPADDHRPIVQDDSELPLVQGPTETPIIEDITNKPIVQDITDPDIIEDTLDESPSAEEPIVQDAGETRTAEAPSDEPLIQDITDLGPVPDAGKVPAAEEDVRTPDPECSINSRDTSDQSSMPDVS